MPSTSSRAVVLKLATAVGLEASHASVVSTSIDLEVACRPNWIAVGRDTPRDIRLMLGAIGGSHLEVEGYVRNVSRQFRAARVVQQLDQNCLVAAEQPHALKAHLLLDQFQRLPHDEPALLRRVSIELVLHDAW